MYEDIYQVFRRIGKDYVELLASDMSITNAMIFMQAWLEGNYNDLESSLEIRRQPQNMEE